VRTAEGYQDNDRNDKAGLFSVVAVVTRDNGHQKSQGIFDRRQCSTGTSYPENLQNVLMQVFRTLLGKTQLPDLIIES